MPRFLDQFFATGADLREGLRAVEGLIRVEYVLTGMFHVPTVIRYCSGLELPHLGTSVTGEHILDPSYVVVMAGTPIEPRCVPQRRGGSLYVVGPEECPGHMIFHPGGQYGDNVLISGELGLSYLEDSTSRRIYDVFRTHFFKHFEKTLNHYIGPEAMRMWQCGARLTQDVGRSRAFDLLPNS